MCHFTFAWIALTCPHAECERLVAEMAGLVAAHAQETRTMKRCHEGRVAELGEEHETELQV